MLLHFVSIPQICMSTESDQKILQLRQSIISLDLIKSHTTSLLEQEDGLESLSNTDKKEYVVFINYLESRIRSDCKDLFEIDRNAAQGTPCPQWSSIMSDNQKSKMVTPSEQTSQLDMVLTQSLSEFDETLLHEERKTANRIPNRSETNSDQNKQGNNGSSTREDNADASNGNSEDEGQNSGKSTDNNNSAQPSDTTTPSTGIPEQDLNKDGRSKTESTPQTAGQQKFDPKDDDIIARQLREAAEKETDPELKEKLWEEYRKYREKSF